jgi:hypothetical protein
MTRIVDPVGSLFEEVLPIIVGTRRRDGTVQLNAAWFEYRDDHFWLNTWRGAHWLDHIEQQRGATLLLLDHADWQRTAQLLTRLVETTSVGAAEHADRLSFRYTGHPYQGQRVGRVLIKLSPFRVVSPLLERPTLQSESPTAIQSLQTVPARARFRIDPGGEANG